MACKQFKNIFVWKILHKSKFSLPFDLEPN